MPDGKISPQNRGIQRRSVVCPAVDLLTSGSTAPWPFSDGVLRQGGPPGSSTSPDDSLLAAVDLHDSGADGSGFYRHVFTEDEGALSRRPVHVPRRDPQ